MFYLWLVFHANLDYRKISLLIQGISFYLYIPLSLSSSCLLCAVYIPPVLHVLNIVFICHITFVSPILYLSRLCDLCPRRFRWYYSPQCPFLESENIVGIFFSKIGILRSLKVKAYGKLSCLIHAGQNLFLCVCLLVENYVLDRM